MLKYILLGAGTILVGFLINPLLGWALLGFGALFTIYSLIPNYYAYKGNVAFTQGKDKETIEFYQKAYQTGRSSALIRISYAFVLIRSGQPEEAERLLNNILVEKKLPNDKKMQAKQNRCMAIYSQGRLDEALEDALELFEEYKNSTMYGMIGYLKLLSGHDLNDVLEFCLEAYDFNDEDRDILDNLSLVYFKLGEYEKAEEISKKLLSKAPKFIEAYYHGAMIADKLGKFAEAIEMLEQVEQCKRSALTTVSEEEITSFKEELVKKTL